MFGKDFKKKTPKNHTGQSVLGRVPTPPSGVPMLTDYDQLP